MNNDRHTRRADLLKELAAQFIQHEANSDPMITVTSVDLSPDMRRLIIFVTTIPDGKEQDALVFLKRNATELRNYYKKHARTKHIPHLEFMVDAGEKHRQHIDQISAEIKAGKNTSETNAERGIEL
jgi:ribosome-binding factor A